MNILAIIILVILSFGLAYNFLFAFVNYTGSAKSIFRLALAGAELLCFAYLFYVI